MCTKYGIFCLNDDSPNNLSQNSKWSLDILAVHGLNGERLRTWTESKSQKLWLRDFLPHDMTQARVMTFGYNATAIFENTKAGIRDHARTLLLAVVEARNRPSACRRPLILIGHSLGGLVLKQALVIAQRESQYKQIHDNVRGVIFFGTPHQGSGLADYATTLARIPLAIGVDTHPQLLKGLKKKSKDLKRLTDSFRKYLDTSGISVVSFYELRTLKGLMVVEKASALLTPVNEDPTNEEQIPVNDNHRGMCQFASPDDETYRAAVRSIKRLYENGGLVDVPSVHYTIPHTANPHFTGRTDIRQQLSDYLVFSRKEQVQQRFLLYGMGGSGKTQICLKFAQEFRKKFWGIFWIDTSSTETAQESFLSIARACKLEESIDSVKAWLASKRDWLLIFDNADDPDLDISRFFPHCTESTILITSRNPDLQRLANAGSCKVDVMSSDDALSLLLEISAQARDNEHAKVLAEQIVKDLGYLALALVQAGAVIRQGICSLDGFSELYSQQKRELLECGRSSSTSEYHSSVFTTWEISVRRIGDVDESHAKLALELLRLFSFMHFDSIDKSIFELATAPCGEDAEYGEEGIFRRSLLRQVMPSGWNGVLWGKAVALLSAFSLITVENSHRISMHPLVHEWSRDRMSDAESNTAWDTALVTVARSATHEMGYTDVQQRRRLLPHIETLMANEDGKMFAPGVHLKERTYAAAKFMLAYSESGQFEKALKIGLEDLKSKEGILSPSNQHILTIRANVAINMGELSQFTESATLQQSLIGDILASSLADTDPATFTNLILSVILGLASNYSCLGLHQKAIDTCTRSINEYGLHLPPENPAVLGLREVITIANLRIGNVTESIPATETILSVRTKACGPAHPMTLMAMGTCFCAYSEAGMYDRAWDVQERCVSVLRDTYGDEHPQTKQAMFALAELPLKYDLPRMKWRKALVYREEVLRLMREEYGDRELRTWVYVAELAMEWFRVGEVARALEMQGEVVRGLEKLFGLDGEGELLKRARKDLVMIRKAFKARSMVGWLVPGKVV
ncbi:hypothetical protein DL98DRAFT_487647 [Cadophora sp. DSE1049]|nr:hypothetical protein DL98DRAFT_487647 [Cadophora sp. DSE1049]